MKLQALCPSKDKSKRIKVSSAAILLGFLMVNIAIFFFSVRSLTDGTPFEKWRNYLILDILVIITCAWSD